MHFDKCKQHIKKIMCKKNTKKLRFTFKDVLSNLNFKHSHLALVTFFNKFSVEKKVHKSGVYKYIKIVNIRWLLGGLFSKGKGYFPIIFQVNKGHQYFLFFNY